MSVRLCLFAIAILAATGCLAEEGMPAAQRAKPACTAETAHMLWPERSERQSGGLVEICMEKHFRYKWQPLTVDVSELRAKVKRAAGSQATDSQISTAGKVKR